VLADRLYAVELTALDDQIWTLRNRIEIEGVSDIAWRRMATAIHSEVRAIDEQALRGSLPISPERYAEEMEAFQAWMNFAAEHRENPVLVRAQVMTELYVAFVWLHGSLMRPLSERVDETTVFAAVWRFFDDGQRRHLRAAIAHGRWTYTRDFKGLELWMSRSERLELQQADLDAWQMLSRGVAIAALLALTEE
jgi:hypothetical protein